jgi:uncharacterized protein
MSQLSTTWIQRLGEPYLPGTGRDPPRAPFEDIKQTIPKRVDAEILQSAPAYTLARELYGARYFWEAHEVLEPMWMACLPDSKERHFLQGLLQLTTACIKLRMRQQNGAVRCVRETEKFIAEAHGLDVGFDLSALLDQCVTFRAAILTGDVGEGLHERPTLAPMRLLKTM